MLIISLQASICKFMLGPRTAGVAKAFCDSIHKTLGGNDKKVLEAYNINADQSDKEGLYNILKFSTDISFFAPTVAFAQGWPGKSYVYHFNEGNPWDGEWKGEAVHVLDVAYLFQNYNEFLGEAQRQVAVTFAGDFIKFVNGKWPTTSFGTKEGAQIYGPSGKGFTSEFVEGIATEKSGSSWSLVCVFNGCCIGASVKRYFVEKSTARLVTFGTLLPTLPSVARTC